MHRRPSGITLSAVILGIISAFLLLSGLFDVVVGVTFAASPGLMPATPGQPAPPANLLPLTFGFLALMTLLCGGWGLGTTVGLMRMRRWARISIMIIGGCLVAFSLIELFGSILVQFTMSNMVLPPNSGSLVPPNPDALRAVFFFVEAICIAIAALGIWWLIYFALRRTGDAFRQAALSPALSSTAQLNPAGPITDFSVAQPVLPTQPAVAIPITDAAPEAPGRPISMTILAVLLFLCAFCMLFCCVLPYPLFFFGKQFSGWDAHIIVISMAVLYALAAYGLLRRLHFGWLLAVGMQCLALLNILTLLAPPVRDRWFAYNQALVKSMLPTTPGGPFASAQVMQQKMMTMMLVPGLVFGVLYVLFILVLLWRARWWYKTTQS